jgi:hypothetical protein
MDDKINKLDTLYKYIDFENLTINNNFKEEEIPEDIKNILSDLKLQLFGSYNPIKFKRIILPYYLQTNNIIQLFKILLNNTITQQNIQHIINLYNNNEYTIICKDGKEYMRFDNDPKYDILLNKMNSIYDNLIKKELSNDISLLNAYNEKKYTIDNIRIINNKYNFDFLSNPIEIPLMNINDNTIIDKKVTKYNTNFHFENIDLLITNYYEQQNELENKYGDLQNKYSQYILLEKLIPFIDTPIFKTIEDIMLIESIIDEQTINNLWNNYKTVNDNKLITEIDHFYICNKKKEVTYKESIRVIIPRRFLSLIIYISRLYNESSIVDEKLENLKFVYIEILDNYHKSNNNLLTLNNNIITIFDKWFQFIHTNFSYDFIKKQYEDIINGKFISKLNSLNVVKKARNQLKKSKREIMDNINDNFKNIKKISIDAIANPQKVVNDSMETIKETITGLFKSEDSDHSDHSDHSEHSNENQIENIGGFDFESNFLTGTIIQNRLQRWVSGLKNNNIYYPTIIQFVDDYVNDDHDIDLISYKNKEKVCKEISELKNTIKENIKDIKYLLPKTFFDNDQFMIKYFEEVDKEKTVKQNSSH